MFSDLFLTRSRIHVSFLVQEQLLLSVIPAYIAAEVKRRIMLKMASSCNDNVKRPPAKQRFHELYVQRHNNVRWARSFRN